ncbi:MAG: hypothetical protein IKK14_07790 [Oscillospiraceae bacterium]|nr:hypothetical protein [Oscillospiraceae bacterium]
MEFLSIIIALIALVFSVYTYRKSVVHERKKATLDAYNRLQNEALDNINLYSSQRIAGIIENPRSEEFKKLGAYIARIEHFCVGVNKEIYDKDTVYELAHGYFDGGLRKRIEPIINRKNINGHDFYENIHKVYAWMDEKTGKDEK